MNLQFQFIIPRHSVLLHYYLQDLGPLRPPRPDKSIGAAGTGVYAERRRGTSFRRLLANEVLDTFAGEVLGCGVALRILFWLFTITPFSDQVAYRN